MSQEIETVIHTQDKARIAVSNWDEDKVWVNIMIPNGMANAVLTRQEAQQMLQGLQAILDVQTVEA